MFETGGVKSYLLHDTSIIEDIAYSYSTDARLCAYKTDVIQYFPNTTLDRSSLLPWLQLISLKTIARQTGCDGTTEKYWNYCKSPTISTDRTNSTMSIHFYIFISIILLDLENLLIFNSCVSVENNEGLVPFLNRIFELLFANQLLYNTIMGWSVLIPEPLRKSHQRKFKFCLSRDSWF